MASGYTIRAIRLGALVTDAKNEQERKLGKLDLIHKAEARLADWKPEYGCKDSERACIAWWREEARIHHAGMLLFVEYARSYWRKMNRV